MLRPPQLCRGGKESFPPPLKLRRSAGSGQDLHPGIRCPGLGAAWRLLETEGDVRQEMVPAHGPEVLPAGFACPSAPTLITDLCVSSGMHSSQRLVAPDPAQRHLCQRCVYCVHLQR